MERNKKIRLGVYFVLGALVLAALAVYTPLALITKRGKGEMMWVVVSLVTALFIMAALIVGCMNLKTKSRYFTSQNITKLAIFTALSYILYMFIKIKLPFMFPDFLELQISDTPALLAGFMMGPLSAIIVVVMKILLKLPFTTTACVGELGDLIIGLVFAVPASFIYKFVHKKKGAVIGLAAGSLMATAASLFVNRFILIPLFLQHFLSMEMLLGGLAVLYPKITVDTLYDYYLWLGVLPFNILRCLITSLVTFFLYKSLKRLFEKAVPTLNANARGSCERQENAAGESVAPDGEARLS